MTDRECHCRRCIAERGDTINGLPRLMCEMIVCPTCGDKRCVHAHDHEAPCAKVDLYAHNSWVERALAAMTVQPEGEKMSDAELDALLLEIGIARFVGRINSGLLEPVSGYAAVQRLVDKER